jgi:O6-methylguanine-DNA--protein-cysteine methyltransferase
MIHTTAVPADDDGPALFGFLAAPAPPDFALRVLRRAGIPEARYDTYASVATAAGTLLVATGRGSVTGASLASELFEEQHLARTGRSAIRVGRPGIPGLITALRTGRARHLPITWEGLTPRQAAILTAVRSVPKGQLRPAGWILREAGPVSGSAGDVQDALRRNPVAVLVPTHRVTDDLGVPLDPGYPAAAAELLRRHEGIDTSQVRALAEAGTRYIGSDTTRVFCLPTCANARRITGRHRVPFGTPDDATSAGYRPCKACRPAVA